MQANEIETGFAAQPSENKRYGLTKMTFNDGTTLFGHFQAEEQSPILTALNRWVFYFDELKLVLSGNDIAEFNNIYLPA